MAEITQPESSRSSGKIRAKRLSTKIDMTPMVDLAFLLLTFFILTSTFTKSNLMQVDMPENVDSSLRQPVSEKNILNLVLSENDKIYWWNEMEGQVQTTNYSKDGVRRLLLESRQANQRLVVLIKPSDESRYQNIVDILDEMEITKTSRYSIMELTENDKALIATAK
jgi:biopolymer transport protein ExbD